ncbi:cell adhesion molecule [Sarcoptes scabiei]|nr:cell adhesion molecule [Sarcoptes scabiei]
MDIHIWLGFVIILNNLDQNRADKPIIMKTSAEHKVVANSSYVLQCFIISGSQPIYFEWLKENRPLNSAYYKIDSQKTLSLLTLENLQPSAAGIYKCLARNVFGSHSIETNLIVQVRPKCGAKFLKIDPQTIRFLDQIPFCVA